ncbi:MAG: recombinase family protein [Peptococcaceae bacterium]|nr:recombinase family protein [Peptococcaceae bacterium]MBQ3508554.1 recombinase family protein [Peptococcaceae bacterium]
MNNKQLKVAAYCRVSTDKEDQANSLESQRQYFEAYITRQEDWDLVEVYYDEGISGTSLKNRDGFNRMLEAARSRKIDVILTKEVSRFARNTVDTLQITRELKQLGVGVHFLNDGINTMDTERDWELRLAIMASIAQEESRKTSERVKWGQKRQMEKGVVFGRDMLGYRVENGKLIIVPEEAEIVRLIFHKYLNEGKGTTTIAKELHEAGIFTINGNLWSNTVLLRLLRNEKYVGDLLQKKTYTPDYLTHSKKYNKGEEEQVYLKDHHEAIIDRETWEATQRELERRSPSPEHKTKHSNRYWCSGKLICGECGKYVVSRKKKLKNGGIRKAWMCVSATQHGISKVDADGNLIGCDNKEVNDKVIQAAAKYTLSLVQSDKDKLVSEVMNEIRSVQKNVPKVDVAKLQKEIENLEKKKIKIVDLFLEETLTKETFMKQQQHFDDEIAKVKLKINGVEQWEEMQARQIEMYEKMILQLERMICFDLESEEIYKQVIGKIILYKNKKLEVRLNGIPVNVLMRYTVSGKCEDYKVEFDEVELVA